MAIIRSTNGTCSPLSLGAPSQVTVQPARITVQPAQVNVTIENMENEANAMATNSNSSSGTSCGGAAGSPSTQCYQIDPTTGNPIDPTTGLPYISPTRKIGDPQPTQPTQPTPGKGSDGNPTVNPDPKKPTDDPLPVNPDTEKRYDFPCSPFIKVGPDAASFTFAALDVTQNIKDTVAATVPTYDPALDTLVSVSIDCEGLSYDGVSLMVNQSQAWSFTDSVDTHNVQYVLDRRGLGLYTVNVRVDSDRGIVLAIGDGNVVTSGQFSQGPAAIDYGIGIGIANAGYAKAGICSAVIRPNQGCKRPLPYFVNFDTAWIDDNKAPDCWGSGGAWGFGGGLHYWYITERDTTRRGDLYLPGPKTLEYPANSLKIEAFHILGIGYTAIYEVWLDGAGSNHFSGTCEGLGGDPQLYTTPLTSLTGPPLHGGDKVTLVLNRTGPTLVGWNTLALKVI